LECARAKALGDYKIYKTIKPLLEEYRVAIEADLRKMSLGL
jgi:hypothetical protein